MVLNKKPPFKEVFKKINKMTEDTIKQLEARKNVKIVSDTKQLFNDVNI